MMHAVGDSVPTRAAPVVVSMRPRTHSSDNHLPLQTPVGNAACAGIDTSVFFVVDVIFPGW